MPNKGKRLGLLTGLMLCVTGTAIAADPEPTNLYLIQTAGSGANLAAAVEAAGGRLVHEMPEIGYVSAQSDDPKFAKRLRKAKGVQAVDQDFSVQWLPELQDLEVTGAQFSPAEQPEILDFVDPNLAFFGACQWSNDQIDTAGAWAKGETGDGSLVAVLDSGVDPFHLEMIDKIHPASTETVTAPDPGFCDFFSNLFFGVSDTDTIFDFRFHGAFVAGQIAAHGFATAGVAPDADILGVKVFDCSGSGPFSDVIAGIYYAANTPGVDVINMSLGAYIPSRKGLGPLIAAMNRAVNYANSKGILVVSAAGNSGADLQHDGNAIALPAESGAGIATWAGDIEGDLASYSNHGANKVKLGAGGGSGPVPSTQVPLPGCGLPAGGQFGIVAPCATTSIFFLCDTGDNYLFGGSGTSFSAPMVSGVAALLDGKYGGALGAGDLKDALKASADDIGAPGTDNEFGQGRVNASSAVDH